MADARGRLGQAVLETPLFSGWTVRQASRRLDADQALSKAIGSVQMTGSPRWQESGICQVRVELSGSAIADVLTVASQAARDAELSVPKISGSLIRLRTLSFTAVGQSVAPAELGKVTVDLSAAWLAIPVADRVKALQSARANAVGKLLEQLRPVPLPSSRTLGDVVANDEKSGSGGLIRTWLANRPVAGIEFRTGLECRLILAVPAERFWPVLRDAIGKSALGPPTEDAGAWSRLQQSCAEVLVPVIGTGYAGRRPPEPIAIPATPPTWSADQFDAEGKSGMVGLKGARAAEADAIGKLKGKVLGLQLGSTTVGEAADRDPAFAKVVDGFVQQSRVTKVVYSTEGTAVCVSADLAQLWRQILMTR